MRISDWSSDVCSSDLTRYSGISVPGSDRPVAILPDRGAEALVQQCFAARRHRTPSDRADNAVRIILEGVQVGQLDDPRRRSGPAGSDQACGQAGAELQSGESRHVRDRLQVAAFRSNRSEEHTSELQSLMRISYAVFCLKKKTTKQINTY